MKSILALMPVAIAVVIGGFFFWGLNPDRDPKEIPSALISQPVPYFDLAAVEGLETPGLASVDLEAPGGPVVVNVFASWCVPCRAEHAVLTRMVREDGMRLYGINYKDKPEDARAWLEELGNPYARIGADVTGRVGIEWGLSGVPETFIVDASGTIVFRYVGPILGEEPQRRFRRALEDAGAGGAQS